MDLSKMTAQELLGLIAQAAQLQEQTPAAPATPTAQAAPVAPATQADTEEVSLEQLKAENAKLKALTAYGITEEVYEEQSKFINFEAMTPEQYTAMFGQASPSNQGQVDPVSKYAAKTAPNTPALNENDGIDVAIAAALGLK